MLTSLPSVKEILSKGRAKYLRVEPLTLSGIPKTKQGAIFFSFFQLVTVMAEERRADRDVNAHRGRLGRPRRVVQRPQGSLRDLRMIKPSCARKFGALSWRRRGGCDSLKVAPLEKPGVAAATVPPGVEICPLIIS